MHSTQEVEEVRDYSNFFVSFVVSSFFTNIRLNKITESALDYIISNNPDDRKSKSDFEKLF